MPLIPLQMLFLKLKMMLLLRHAWKWLTRILRRNLWLLQLLQLTRKLLRRLTHQLWVIFLISCTFHYWKYLIYDFRFYDLFSTIHRNACNVDIFVLMGCRLRHPGRAYHLHPLLNPKPAQSQRWLKMRRNLCPRLQNLLTLHPQARRMCLKPNPLMVSSFSVFFKQMKEMGLFLFWTVN